MRILIVSLLVIVCLSASTIADEDAQPNEGVGVVFIYQGDQSIEAYLREHRCMVGWWGLRKKTEYGWIGQLSYYSTNDDPRGRVYISEKLKILRPKGIPVPLGIPDLNKPPHEQLVVIHPAEKKGYYELIGHWGPKSKARPERWWAGELNFNWEQYGDRRFCYVGLVDEGRQLLTKSDDNERSHGAYLLGTLGKDALPAEPALLKLLRDENQYVRCRSAVALAKIGGPGASQTFSFFTELLNSKDDTDKYFGFHGLRCLGPGAKKAVPQLIELLQDQRDGFAALETLVVVAPEDAQVQEAIKSWRATLSPNHFKLSEELFKEWKYNLPK